MTNTDFRLTKTVSEERCSLNCLMAIMIYVATLYAAESDIVKVWSMLKTISVIMG